MSNTSLVYTVLLSQVQCNAQYGDNIVLYVLSTALNATEIVIPSIYKQVLKSSQSVDWL